MAGHSKIILFCAIALIAVSCLSHIGRSKTVRERNLADIYNPSKTTLHPDISIVHVSDSNSVAYVRIYPAELLFNDANQDGILKSDLSVHFELGKITDGKPETLLIDSATIKRSLKKTDAKNSYVIGLPLKAAYGFKYSLKLETKDELRNTFSEVYKIVDKTSWFNEQNFNLLSAVSNYPAFTNTFVSGEFFKLKFNQSGYDSIYVEYYDLDRTVPRPAFSSAPDLPLKEFPDTSYYYPFSDTIIYELPLPGIYHFKVKLDSQIGLTLFNFGQNFPKIKSPDDLLGPLVYLTTSSEFRDLRMEPNRKLAIDNFWLRLNTDVESSKELIRVYYNRVLYANLFFSSYKEGWKTDRGMIYIIFGPPRLLEKNIGFEKWTYFSKSANRKVEFIFNRKENKFTNYDYQLARDVDSNSYWRIAIQSWRKGKVFSFSL
jgi:GWxTD domain-containing protein